MLVFDLLYRTYGYPLEYVIEALAPTTERDSTLLPADKQEIYRMLQTVHIHGSPDGPWFFLIAQSVPSDGVSRLIGITDTSMLRPQVFALQEGEASIGFAASEKQAIDAALESLSAEDSRFWTRADRYWNARGGSHTDGGAFVFTVNDRGDGSFSLDCTNKFGQPIIVNTAKPPRSQSARRARDPLHWPDIPARELFAWVKQRITQWDYDDLSAFAGSLSRGAESDADRTRAIETLTLLLDRRYPACRMRPSNLRSLLDQGLNDVVGAIQRHPSQAFAFVCPQSPCPRPANEAQTAVIDARPYPPEGKNSLARQIVELYQRGFGSVLVASAKGHRFIANGLGPNAKMRVNVYGSSGDYLASGIDGAEVFVHGNAQDQLAQIMKDGKLVVFGDVGQTFMYGAKGGQAFVLGNAAGRPLINAVGRPRVVINGTCLDYLAESFMAGDPLDNGGFVILNGVAFDDDVLLDLDSPYPGGNLFSLSSGGAIYVRDPLGKVSEEQLNGGEFVPLEEADWELIKPYLNENQLLFGIPVSRLLVVYGKSQSPEQVYRKIRPCKLEALQAEEAWIRGNG